MKMHPNINGKGFWQHWPYLAVGDGVEPCWAPTHRLEYRGTGGGAVQQLPGQGAGGHTGFGAGPTSQMDDGQWGKQPVTEQQEQLRGAVLKGALQLHHDQTGWQLYISSWTN